MAVSPSPAELSPLTELPTGRCEEVSSPWPSSSVQLGLGGCVLQSSGTKAPRCSQHMGHRGPCPRKPFREGHEDEVMQLEPPQSSSPWTLFPLLPKVPFLPLSALSVFSLAPLLFKVWCVDQQHQHHLGTQKRRILGLPQPCYIRTCI